jgi:hypothetical protein
MAPVLKGNVQVFLDSPADSLLTVSLRLPVPGSACGRPGQDVGTERGNVEVQPGVVVVGGGQRVREQGEVLVARSLGTDLGHCLWPQPQP